MLGIAILGGSKNETIRFAATCYFHVFELYVFDSFFLSSGMAAGEYVFERMWPALATALVF